MSEVWDVSEPVHIQRIVDYQKFRSAYEMVFLSHDDFVTLAAPCVRQFANFQPIVWHLVIADDWSEV